MYTKLHRIWIVLFIIVTPALLQAETMYITDTLEVAVRAGKGLEYKILAIAKSNDHVEVLAIDGEYAHIQLANGIEGWTLRRYLTQAKPKPIVISELTSQVAKLQEKQATTTEKMRELKKEKKELEKTSTRQEKKINTLEDQYNELKVSCTDYIALKDDYDNSKKELIKLGRKISLLTSENDELRKNTNLLWFIAGSAAVLIGFIIGLILQNVRYKRRREIRF